MAASGGYHGAARLRRDVRESFIRRLSAIVGGDHLVPKVLSLDRTKVLKVGVLVDLKTRFPGVDHGVLQEWIGDWTGSEVYLQAVVNKKHRHDLDGNDVGFIGVNDKAFAYWMLRRLKMVDRTLGRRPTYDEAKAAWNILVLRRKSAATAKKNARAGAALAAQRSNDTDA